MLKNNSKKKLRQSKYKFDKYEKFQILTNFKFSKFKKSNYFKKIL